MAISDLRAGLKANLQTIANIRVYDTLPDVTNPPAALISLEKISYTQQNRNSMALYSFKVTVVLGRVAERTAQKALDVLVDVGGVKTALESDPFLGGSAFEVFVPEMSAYGAVSINGIDYLSAEFSVSVYA